MTEVGSQCKLTFKMPGITSFDLSATVTSPGNAGVTEDAEVQEIEDGLYSVSFVPKELGIHTGNFLFYLSSLLTLAADVILRSR